MPTTGEGVVKDLSDLFVPIELARILIDRKLYDEAADVYLSRLADELPKIGASQIIIQLLSPLFEIKMQKVVSKPKSKIY